MITIIIVIMIITTCTIIIIILIMWSRNLNERCLFAALEMESFKVLDINEAIPKGFRMAKFKDIVDLEHLRSILGRDKTWYICRLQDGKVAGPGYGYEIIKQQPDTGLGHKLLVKTLHSGGKPVILG